MHLAKEEGGTPVPTADNACPQWGQVTRQSPHFRHINPALPCDPDAALHTYAIRTIADAHAKAGETGGEYQLTRLCSEKDISGCHNYATKINLAEGWECDVEKSIVPHTRSDLVFTAADGRQIAVEVVVTHEMEPQAEDAFQSAGVPVAVVQVKEWSALDQLFGGLAIDDSRNFNNDTCNACAERQAEADNRLDRRKRYVNNVLSRMTRRRVAEPLFRPWREAKDSLPMFPRTQRRVFANAIILTELGFEQHNPRKSWLFRFTIHRKSNVVLYADLGGSDVIPIYEDTAAMLYVFGDGLDDDDDYGHYECCTGSPISHYVIEEFGRRLQQFGVDVRTGFLAPENVERIEVQPLRKVDRKQLERFVAA